MKKPLLQSASVIRKCIDAMHSYMQTLPLYCEHFLTMMCTTVRATVLVTMILGKIQVTIKIHMRKYYF